MYMQITVALLNTGMGMAIIHVEVEEPGNEARSGMGHINIFT